MAAKKSPAVQLAEKMLQVLEAQRSLGPGSYPATLQRLAELADATTTEEMVLKAVTAKPFKSRVVELGPKRLQSRVVLKEDLETYLRSDKLLLELLESACNSSQPTVDVTKLNKALPAKCRAVFDAGLQQRIEAIELPTGVAILSVKGKQHLHLRKYELPRKPEVVLAERLVATLRNVKSKGTDGYPAKFSQLLAATPGAEDAKLLARAMKLPEYASQVELVLKAKPKAKHDDIVSLVEDRERVATSSWLLETLIRANRTADHQVWTSSEAKKLLAPVLLGSFERNLAQQVATRNLPPSVGSLVQKKGKTHVRIFFLMEDCRGGAMPDPTASSAARPAMDFGQAFERAFANLEGQGSRGGNFVNLHSLRRALPFSRQEFDRGLQTLRGAGRFGLSATEDPSMLSSEERAAAIEEDGQWLFYVSRKTS